MVVDCAQWAKECCAGQRPALAPTLRPAVMDPNGRMNVGWIWGYEGATLPPTGPSKRDRPRATLEPQPRASKQS